MSDYKWSPSHNNFFPESMLGEYEQAGWDLSDLISIGDDIFKKFSSTPPAGKARVCGGDGMPSWADVPPRSHEELAEEAEAKKQDLIAGTTATIAPLQDAVDLDIATPEEISALKEWKTYRVMLNRVDTSLGADVVWPTRPA